MKLEHLILERRKTPEGMPDIKKAPLKEYKERFFCEGCQQHFAKLEELTKPLLVPMIDGKPITLRYYERRTLATWVAKTSYCILAHDRIPVQPVRSREVVRQVGEAPPDCGIFLTPYDSAQIRLLSHIGQFPGEHFDIEGTVTTYNVVMAFGRVAIKFFGIVERVEDFTFILPTFELEPGKPVAAALALWPPPHLIWPPPGLPPLPDAIVQAFNEFPAVLPPRDRLPGLEPPEAE
jgi:hypothetical protein